MEEIASNIYVSTDYPLVTVGFVVRPGGAIAVDAPTLPDDARAWRQQIVATAGGPILYTVLTDAHPHRLLSAGLLNAPIITSQAAYRQAADYTSGFWRTVGRQLKRRFPEARDELSNIDVTLPEILVGNRVRLHKGEADVLVERNVGASPGTLWVDLQEEGALFVGDTLTVGTPPPMDSTPDTKAWLNTLTALRRPHFSDIALVPGRGPIAGQSDTRPLSEYIRVARRRIRSLHRAKRPEDDVAEFVDELLSIFTIPEDDRDRLERRVERGLERVYEELQPTEDNQEENG